MSWFYYYYLQDVERLRDDIIAVPAWDLVGENPPGMLTSRRYPDLKFPPPAAFDFSNMENNAAYNRAFLELNRKTIPSFSNTTLSILTGRGWNLILFPAGFYLPDILPARQKAKTFRE